MEKLHPAFLITAIGQDVGIERYLTTDTIRLGVSGLAAGLLAGVVWRLAGRSRWGAAVFLVAVVAACGVTGRSDWPRWSAATGCGAIVAAMAAAGVRRLLAEPGVGWPWLALGALISTAGAWAGVPEVGPVLIVGGALVGLAVMAVLTRSQWSPSAGLGLAAILGWAALSGAAGRPWAAVGGSLCFGVAPWLALSPFSTFRPPKAWAGVGLLSGHAVLVILAARWIAVDPHAGWWRTVILAGAGLAVVRRTRRRA